MDNNPTICEEKLTTNNKSPLSIWIICSQFFFIYIYI